MMNFDHTLRLLFDNSRVSLAVLKVDFTFIRVNRAYAEQQGRPVEFFPGRNHFDLCSADIQQILESIRDQSTLGILPAHRLGGPEWPVSRTGWTLDTVPDANGAACLFILRSIEATEKEYVRRAERESRDWFRCMLELSSEAMVVHQGGKVLNFNHAAADLFGYGVGDWKHQGLQDFIVPEDIPVAIKRMNDKSGEPYELTGLHKDGTWIPLEVQARSVKYAERDARCVVLRDLSERKKVENRLYARGAMLRQAAKLAHLGNWEWTAAAGRCVHFSKEYARIIGVTVDEALARYATREQENELIHPDDRARYWRVIDQAETDGAGYEIECRIIRPDGELRHVMIVGELIRDRDGSVIRALGTMQDITGLKQSEARLRAAKEEAEFANNSKSEFLSRVSHELRTPLNAILGFSQLLELDNENLSQEQKEGVSLILSGGKHLLRLIDEVLDIARVDSGNMQLTLEPVSLTQALSGSMLLVNPLAKKYKVAVEMASIADFHVHADGQRLKQVLVNLLSNAVKYNCKNGTVKIGAKAIDGGLVRISVSDTGRGIREEDMTTLFEPFTRVGGSQFSEEGTGIGLAITKRLVELMGGVIGVDSEFGKGATFWFVLAGGQSLDDVPEKSETAAPARVSSKAKNLKVLYVEDIPINMKLMQELVSRTLDSELICATNAVDGIELARSEQPDLILMDISLPGMNGFEALEVLKADEKTSGIPVMAVTAHAMPEQVEQAKNSAFRHYLVKPVIINDFIEAVNEVASEF